MPRPLNRYSTVAIILHWLIALLIFFNIWQGLRLDDTTGLAKFTLFQSHKSIGITILVLSLVRLAWRLGNPPPPAAVGLAHWEKTASGIVHWAFYVIMIGMPLTGWLSVSASKLGLPTVLYRGVLGFPGIPWPHLPFIHGLPMGERKSIEDAADAAHGLLAYGAYGLIALHVLGALKHQFMDPNPVLPRMLPFMKRRAANG